MDEQINQREISFPKISKSATTKFYTHIKFIVNTLFELNKSVNDTFTVQWNRYFAGVNPKNSR